ncbi:PEP-CTERM sorting domain-containing protein [Methylophilus sp.]|uniref:PEP-CTERM sorting domain-containing protein n=1 Tax=Methylophilus sp. TaxID=29541 RepID=UPI004036D494
MKLTSFKASRAMLLLGLTLSMNIAHAALITDPVISSGVANLNFDAYPDQEFTLGPVALTASNGSNVIFTATQPFGVAGFSSVIYGLGENGVWSNPSQGGYTFAAINGDEEGGLNSTLRFTFQAGPVSMVGGIMNYVFISGDNPYYDPEIFSIKALDINGQVLESYKLESDAPIRTTDQINSGAFRGISRTQADIYSFEIQGGGVLRNLQFSAPIAIVPEPNAYALFMFGLAFIAYRKSKNAS